MNRIILTWCALDNMFRQYDGHTKREPEYQVAIKVEDIRDQLMYRLALQFRLDCCYPSYETFVEYTNNHFTDMVKWDKEKEKYIDIYTGEAL